MRLGRKAYFCLEESFSLSLLLASNEKQWLEAETKGLQVTGGLAKPLAGCIRTVSPG